MGPNCVSFYSFNLSAFVYLGGRNDQYEYILPYNDTNVSAKGVSKLFHVSNDIIGKHVQPRVSC
jgi:hypothetical protein